MNLRYLVIAVTLLATSSILSSDATTVANSDSKKVLRRLQAKPSVDTNSQDEERLFWLWKVDKVDDIPEKLDDILAKMKNDIPSFVPMFEKWTKLTVAEKLETPTMIALRKADNDEYMRMLYLYGEFWALGKEKFISMYKNFKDKTPVEMKNVV
ncbi:RxLR effector protein [Phytophthora megakarya]|uniref:RxLR effector protein n=1 Tax=Phytophthora megakarya TaxID=4795 RepID=A0A225WUZ6_9STRA|nr:RxLR effector protein [Phytophthora megakarya]